MASSRFQPPQISAPAGRKLSPQSYFDLRGLNQTAPYDQLQDNESPYLKNCRLFAQDDEERRVAIATRKGPGFYSLPVGETLSTQEVATTGASTAAFSTTTWVGVQFTAGSSARLTKVDLNLRNASGATGHVLVSIYSDSSGSPGVLLAESSVLSSSIGTSLDYEEARFAAAPALVSGTAYWIVLHLQEGGSGTMEISTTTATSTGGTSVTSGNMWTTGSASLNFKTYLSTTGGVLGAFRFHPSNNDAKTIFWHGTKGYSVAEPAGTLTEFATGLSSSATDYYAVQADDKVWFVNGVDVPKKWDGSTVSNVGGTPGVSKLIALHKNRLFLVPTSDPTRVNFSDINSTSLADYETYESTAFFYVPNPRSSDPITGMISFQDQLIIFTRETKYVLSGSDLATFTLRQATGKKGAVSQRVIASDENYVYFLSDDGVYRFNGASDELISDKVTAELADMGSKERASAILHQREYRLYYAPEGDEHFTRMLLYDTTYEDWFLDTDCHSRVVISLTQENDELLEFSEDVGMAYLAEQQYSILGMPIDFEYRTKYHSWGSPASKKQVRRFYPVMRASAQPFAVTLEVDTDFRNSPRDYEIDMQGTGPIWGQFVWGAFTWGQTMLIQPRLSVPNNKTYYQFRWRKRGVDTPVDIINYSTFVRYRRAR